MHTQLRKKITGKKKKREKGKGKFVRYKGKYSIKLSLEGSLEEEGFVA
jgi:hypothetical protein